MRQRTTWSLNIFARLSWLFFGCWFCCTESSFVLLWCIKVEGLMRLMEGEHVGPFNLGNPGEFTMLELAKVSFYTYIHSKTFLSSLHWTLVDVDVFDFGLQVVQETIDPNANIEFRPNTEDDPHKRKPDITKAKELLGWEPKVSLRQGLPLMVKDFRQRVFGDQKEGSSMATTTTKTTSAWAHADASSSSHCELDCLQLRFGGKRASLLKFYFVFEFSIMILYSCNVEFGTFTTYSWTSLQFKKTPFVFCNYKD